MDKSIGINQIVNNLRIIEITPITIMGKQWRCIGFEELNNNRGDFIHIAFVINTNFKKSPKNILSDTVNTFEKDLPTVRIHSECILGDTFYSELCDCGEQLKRTLVILTKAGKGALVYLRQEGRGIGFRAKLSCLALQEGYKQGKKVVHKHTPDEANLALGFDIDHREYIIAASILKTLGATSIRLISGNPTKITTLNKEGIKILKLLDIPRDKITFSQRAHLEIKEKIKRNYLYNL